jgi:hypothetical protein
MNRSSLCLVSTLLVSFVPSCFAQTVTVRVINAKNGHPLSGQGVAISLLYHGSEKAPGGYSAHLSLKTDDNGEAHFRLPQPPPAHMAASVSIDQSRWRCACILLDSTQNVVQFGVVQAEPSGKESSSPKPLEILFVARPLSLFSRIWYQLMKE